MTRWPRHAPSARAGASALDRCWGSAADVHDGQLAALYVDVFYCATGDVATALGRL
jgi:hypothetical protein